MSRRHRECGCGYGPVSPIAGAGCCGFDLCKIVLFLLILKRACIIDHETATILIFLFLLCCCKGMGMGPRFGY